jgi:hypothetical protein
LPSPYPPYIILETTLLVDKLIVPLWVNGTVTLVTIYSPSTLLISSLTETLVLGSKWYRGTVVILVYSMAYECPWSNSSTLSLADLPRPLILNKLS